MMQKIPVAVTAIAPKSKTNGAENQANANTELADVPHAFHTILKKQTQSTQQTTQKPAETDRKTAIPNLSQTTQAETTKSIAQELKANVRENEETQSTSGLMAIDTQQQKEDSLALNVVDEMVALLSIPVETKPAQVETAAAVEPLPTNTAAAEQTVAKLMGSVLVGNVTLNNTESVQPNPQTAGLNTLSSKVVATDLPVAPSNMPENTVDASSTNTITPTPEQSAFASKLSEAKMPMVASQQEITAPASAKLDVDKALNVATAITSLQNNSQPTVTTPVATQQAVATNMIEARLGNAGWNQAISQRVVWMAGAGEQSATLTLNPPDLGPLQVVVHVHNGLADTTFTSDNADVRQALQDGMEHLREKMRESGVQLGQTNVQTGEQSRQDFQQMAEKNRLAPLQEAENNPSPIQNNAAVNKITRVTNGLVDTFA